MREPLRWLFAALLVAFAISVFCGVRQRRELIRERQEAATESRAVADLEDRLAVVEKARVAAEAGLQGPGELNIRRVFPEHGPVPSPGTIDQFNAAVDRDPVWAPFYRSLERRRILSRYNILLPALEIPPEKLAPLEELLVERAIATRYLAHHLRETGQRFNSPEVIAAVARATDDVDLKIERLTGDAIARKLNEWNGAIYTYGNAPDGPAAQDAVTLDEAGFNVSTGQLVKLALIRYEVFVLNPEARSGSGASRIDPKTGLTGLEKELLAREAEILTPEEIAVLRDWTIEEHRARAALDAIRARFHIETDRTPR